jgi:NADH dehydrogenase
MKIAITGSSGFVGRHLYPTLASEGHDLVLISRRTGVNVTDLRALTAMFTGCEAVIHCAGINREIGKQTYAAVHVEGTRTVVNAAEQAGVSRLVLMSFLRARPDCGSGYHESKWAAEEIVRASKLDYTVVKAGMTYGLGDHMLDHISHSIYTLPVFATVGIVERPIRPLAIKDLVAVLRASAVDGRLSRQTVAVVGAEQLFLSEALRRVGSVLGKRVLVVPCPVVLQFMLAQLFEWTMTVPLVSKAQVRILSEGVVEPAPQCDPLPDDLKPRQEFVEANIRAGLPSPERFGIQHMRCCARKHL